MSDIKKILEAMAALAEAIPGGRSSISVNMHDCDDHALRILVENGARIVRFQSDDKTREWEAATLWIGNVQITAFSKQRPIERSEPDADAIAAALAQAQEALP